MAGKVTRTLEERFWEKVGKTPSCWQWNAKKNEKGYGRFWAHGRNLGAHRISWMIAFGTYDSKRLRVLHKCDNPGCVNPEHLFLGTLAENISDRDRKQRTAKGEKNGNRKLTVSQVIEIRRSPDTLDVLARRFCIDRTQVHNIKTRKQWKHV